MSIRNFAASTQRMGAVLSTSGSLGDLLDSVDAAVTAAAANGTISGDVTAAGLVAAIEAAAAALRTQLEGQVTAVSGMPVIVLVSGNPNQNQIRHALDNVMRVVAQSPSEYAEG